MNGSPARSQGAPGLRPPSSAMSCWPAWPIDRSDRRLKSAARRTPGPVRPTPGRPGPGRRFGRHQQRRTARSVRHQAPLVAEPRQRMWRRAACWASSASSIASSSPSESGVRFDEGRAPASSRRSASSTTSLSVTPASVARRRTARRSVASIAGVVWSFGTSALQHRNRPHARRRDPGASARHPAGGAG